MKSRREGSLYNVGLGWSAAALLACSTLAVGGGISLASYAALAQSVPTAATDKAGVPTGAARMKPISRTAKVAPAAGSADAASPVTTGSVAKMAGASEASVASPSAAKSAGKGTGRCTRMAFEVNDYGKDGPTKDAKSLLDKHIATWAAEKGIKKFTVGNKIVNCRLFLDFVVFDEHTCRAEAPVCW